METELRQQVRHPWGCSSVGRAPALQAGGQGFESPHLHSEARKRVSEAEAEEEAKVHSIQAMIGYTA